MDRFLQVHSQFNFGPMCAYLAVNYLDRFLSAYDLPVSSLITEFGSITLLLVPFNHIAYNIYCCFHRRIRHG